MMSALVLMGVGVVACLTLTAGMMLSRSTDYQFWPPGDRGRWWWTYLGLSGLATVALLGASYLDWNTYVFPRPSTLVIGGVLIAIGGLGFVASTLDLGVQESSGMEGELRTGGYYRYSRNPQIVFILTFIGGVVFAVNSLAVLTISVSMAVWFISMPFAEETWLHEQYGREYEEYCREVSRFIGRDTFRRLATAGK